MNIYKFLKKVSLHVLVIALMFVMMSMGISQRVQAATDASGIKVTGSSASASSGTFKVTVNGGKKASDLSAVTITAVSSYKRSASYKAVRQSDGTFTATVDAAKHGYNTGAYKLNAAIRFKNGSSTTVSGSYTFNPKNYFHLGTISGGKVKFYACNLSKSGKVTYEVWSKTNGTDDKTVYKATKKKTYYWASIDFSNLKHSGTVYVKVKVSGKQVGSVFSFTAPKSLISKNGWYYETYNGKTVKLYYEKGKKKTDVSSLVKTKRYYIEVNRAACVVTVYAYDTAKRSYCIPVKAFTVSVGRDVSSSKSSSGLNSGTSFTPLGSYSVCSNGVATKYSLKTMYEPDGSICYARWATHIVGNVYFHSIAVSQRSHTALSYATYNKLGSPASAGCIRMAVADAKWIYNNVAIGTKVQINKGSKSYPGPLGKPATIKIKSSSVKYDPTDPEISDKTKKKDYKAKKITGYMTSAGKKVGY